MCGNPGGHEAVTQPEEARPRFMRPFSTPWCTSFFRMCAASILPQNLDDQPQCLLKIVGYIDDHRKLYGRHDRYVDETHGHVETLGSSASSSDNFSIGTVTSVMPLETLHMSCWIRHDSSDLIITKLTRRSKLSSVLKRLLRYNDSRVAVRVIFFDPLAAKTDYARAGTSFLRHPV